MVRIFQQTPVLIAGSHEQKKKYLGRLIEEPLVAVSIVYKSDDEWLKIMEKYMSSKYQLFTLKQNIRQNYFSEVCVVLSVCLYVYIFFRVITHTIFLLLCKT